jgi:uncharacterized protein
MRRRRAATIPGDTRTSITIQWIVPTAGGPMARGDRRSPPSPPTSTRSNGSLEFVELSSEDPPATRKFLESVFGWSFHSRSMPQGEYLAYEAPGGGRGGIRPTRPTEAPASLSYIRVSDLAEALHRIRTAGGKVVLPRVDVPGMGSFFWFQAPGGPVLACWQDWREEPKKE